MQAIKEIEGGLLVDIEVSPKSSGFSISGYNDWRDEIEVRIKSVPQKGKANQEIIKEFCKLTGKNVELVSGHKSRHKTLKIHRINKKDFEELIKESIEK